MKLAVSNLAWDQKNSLELYRVMHELGYDGLEIVPKRSFKLGYQASKTELDSFLMELKDFSLKPVSIQSLLFGFQGALFSDFDFRQLVFNELSRAFKFAQSLGIKNLVFGSPSIRNVNNQTELQTAIEFFRTIAREAEIYDCTVLIEPNPVIYQTNFLTTTQYTLDFVKKLNVMNLKINLDLGTVLFNHENIDEILTPTNLSYIGHVHISEPKLVKIEEQHKSEHILLLKLLKELDYSGFVSIEMKLQEDIEDIISVLRYIKDVESFVEEYHA